MEGRSTRLLGLNIHHIGHVVLKGAISPYLNFNFLDIQSTESLAEIIRLWVG